MAQTIDKGDRRWRPVDPMRHHREKEWDYRGRAIYHFTLPVEGRYPLFGKLEGESAEAAYVRLNPFGRRVCRMLGGLAQFYKGRGYALKVLAQMVMPDHVHLVIQVLEPLPKSIGAVVRGFKSGCTKVYKEEFYYSGENAAGVQGGAQVGDAGVQGGAQVSDAGVQGGAQVSDAGVQGGAQVGDAGVHGGAQVGVEGERGGAQVGDAGVQGGAQVGVEGERGDAPLHFARIFAGRGSIWQQDAAYYHERILHAPGQLRRMIDYVKDNPRRLWIKSRNPDLFRMHRDTVLCGLSFTSLGNHFLLEWPDRQLVEMSRSADSDTIASRLKEVLAAAYNGAVTYTAAISNGEKLIARTVREQGFPLVVLLADGFPAEGSPHERFYKPGGVYFEACSKGSLLLLEPKKSAYEHPTVVNMVEETLRRKAEARHYAYTAVPHDSKRYRFVALNEIGRLLV